MKNNINTQMLYKPAHDTHNSHKETHKKNITSLFSSHHSANTLSATILSARKTELHSFSRNISLEQQNSQTAPKLATTHFVTSKDWKHRSTQNQTHFHSTSTKNIFSSRQQPFSKSGLLSPSPVGIWRQFSTPSSFLASCSLSSSSRFIFFFLWQEEWVDQPLSSILFSRLRNNSPNMRKQVCANDQHGT